jgi:hypothetical protein
MKNRSIWARKLPYDRKVGCSFSGAVDLFKKMLVIPVKKVVDEKNNNSRPPPFFFGIRGKIGG